MSNTLRDPLKPPLDLLIKLGSLIVHYQEACSTDRHEFDFVSIEQLQCDPDVREWFERMNKLAMLPVKRI